MGAHSNVIIYTHLILLLFYFNMNVLFYFVARYYNKDVSSTSNGIILSIV